ncbi:Hypothetical_protein [Hexamita inflata]|uniref:Hypothetical_protein n=1 Tax=Hexamita inflata TaxID=28002 RepID=A0AA86PCH8_9EUKA|nr:Hypothetical protein HINF_LOCUS21007 [Hexamita inflata]
MSQNYLAENIYFAQDCLILVARLKPASLFSEILFLETSRQILSRFPDYIKCKGVCKTRECVQFRSLCSLTLLNIVYIIVYIIIYIIVYKRSKSIYSLIPEARTNRHSLLFLTFRQVTFEPDSCSITFYQFFYENTCADSFLQPLNATFTMQDSINVKSGIILQQLYYTSLDQITKYIKAVTQMRKQNHLDWKHR